MHCTWGIWPVRPGGPWQYGTNIHGPECHWLFSLTGHGQKLTAISKGFCLVHWLWVHLWKNRNRGARTTGNFTVTWTLLFWIVAVGLFKDTDFQNTPLQKAVWIKIKLKIAKSSIFLSCLLLQTIYWPVLTAEGDNLQILYSIWYTFPLKKKIGEDRIGGCLFHNIWETNSGFVVLYCFIFLLPLPFK